MPELLLPAYFFGGVVVPLPVAGSVLVLDRVPVSLPIVEPVIELSLPVLDPLLEPPVVELPVDPEPMPEVSVPVVGPEVPVEPLP